MSEDVTELQAKKYNFTTIKNNDSENLLNLQCAKIFCEKVPAIFFSLFTNR